MKSRLCSISSRSSLFVIVPVYFKLICQNLNNFVSHQYVGLKRLYHLTHQHMKKAATTIIPRPFGRTVTLCTFDQCDMDSFKLFWLPLPFVDSGNDQFSWLYTSRENLTLLPPNSEGAGQNTHLRSLIIAFIFRYLFLCETARPKIAAFRQGLHCSRTLLNKFNILSDDQTAKVV